MPIGEAAPPQQFSLRTTAGRRLTVQVTSVKVEAEGGEALLSIYRDETERQRAEGARARSEALLSHVVATSPDIITLIDLSTERYVMVNDAFAALSGYARDEAIGRTATELGLWGSAEAHDHFFSEMLAHNGVRDRAVVFRRRDGREVLMLVSAARFVMEGRDYLVLNGRDITQSERARLEREAILANASIGIAMTRDRIFQLANPSFEQMFGWPPGALLGQPGVVTSVDRASYEEMGALFGPPLSRGEAVEFERMMKRRDGSTFLCRLLARPIDPTHPAKGGTIWIAEDVTEKRAVEQALARARDEAEAANRAKSAFLANTSHEIRTPLNGLVGLARLARQPGLDSARREQYLAQIDDSAQALAGVISDILDLSKIEAGKLRLEQTDFDLHALLESVEHGYAALAEAHALTLTMHVSAAVPRRVRGDPVRLRQILSNLISNALKFTELGYVRLHVSGASRPRPLTLPSGDASAASQGSISFGQRPERALRSRRQRPRHRGRGAGAPVPALHAGRRIDDAALRRHGAGLVDLPRARRADGRPRRRAQRAGTRQPLLGRAAAGGERARSAVVGLRAAGPCRAPAGWRGAADRRRQPGQHDDRHDDRAAVGRHGGRGRQRRRRGGGRSPHAPTPAGRSTWC